MKKSMESPKYYQSDSVNERNLSYLHMIVFDSFALFVVRERRGKGQQRYIPKFAHPFREEPRPVFPLDLSMSQFAMRQSMREFPLNKSRKWQAYS